MSQCCSGGHSGAVTEGARGAKGANLMEACDDAVFSELFYTAMAIFEEM